MNVVESETAEEMIAESTTAPSPEFGYLVPIVDHAVLGKKARMHRRMRKVKAVGVARILDLTRVQLCFMESGRRHWDLKTLKAYLKAVDLLASQKEKKK